MSQEHEHPIRHLWLRNGAVWLGLVLLLAMTCTLAYAPLGPFNGPVSIAIATLKALLVLVFYMELKRARPLLRLIAFVPLVFVLVLFALSLSDVLTRI